ncbi:MAG: TonB-dependent receptor [Acidobacteria bacterium]|nr:TonB-dependent receptor [Acidobacteriota bacterium]
MPRSLIACLILLAGAGTAEALVGRVVDARTGAPLGRVHVTLIGHAGSAITDGDGRFTWTPDPHPPFVAVVLLEGGRVGRPIYVEAVSGQDLLTLAVDTTFAELVTVPGIAPLVDAAPGAGMTLVSGDAAARRSPATLTQALEDVPGLSATSDGQAAVPTVRGLARGRTLILVDGGRVSSERRAGPSASFLDPSLIDTIVVARGPGSVAYGTDAFGGVISVRTRRPSDRAPLSVQFIGTVGTGIPERRGLLQLAKGFARGGVLAVAHARDVHDYESPAGRVGNSGWRDEGALVRVEHQAGPGRMSIGAQHDQGRDLGRPRSDSSTVRIFSPFERSSRLSASYEIARVAGLHQVRIDGLAARTHERAEQDRAPASNRPRSGERATQSAQDVQVRARGGRAVRQASLEFGLDASGRYGLGVQEVTLGYNPPGGLVSTLERVAIQSAERTILGSFLQAQLPATSRITVAGGFRLDRVHVANTGGYFGSRMRTDGAAAGFAAVSLAAAPGLSLTARVSRGFRDPTLSDRFYRGPAGRGLVTGNPDLEPETSRQGDLSATYTLRRIRLAASVYHYRITNLVEIYSPAADQFRFRNRGRAALSGAEIELDTDLGRGWRLALQGHKADGRALDDCAPLNDVAPATVAMTASGAIGRRLTAYVRTAAAARDDRPGPSEVRAPGSVDAGAGVALRFGRRLEVRGAARNLLNQRYYASPGAKWVYAPGRSGSLTTSVRF